jgi:hypothetical protein
VFWIICKRLFDLAAPREGAFQISRFLAASTRRSDQVCLLPVIFLSRMMHSSKHSLLSHQPERMIANKKTPRNNRKKVKIPVVISHIFGLLLIFA